MLSHAGSAAPLTFEPADKLCAADHIVPRFLSECVVCFGLFKVSVDTLSQCNLYKME